MRRYPSLCFASLLLLAACPIAEDSSLGDLPGNSGSEVETEGESPTATGKASEDDGDLGLLCELEFTPQSGVLEVNNASCRTGICAYPDTSVVAPFDQPCNVDADCGESAGKIWCDPESQTCKLMPSHVEANSMCSELCEVDTDCVGADGTACESRFICAPMQSLGPLCCQKTCLCADEADIIGAEELEQACGQGVVGGCCDQDPVPEACGS